MAVTITPGSLEPLDENDVVFRQKRALAARQDPTDTFKTESVEVEFGPKDEKTGKRSRRAVTLRYAYNSTYLFAVYADNPGWVDVDRDEWEAGARNAIEKFCAVQNLQIKFGPRPEDSNRYNLMVEVARVIEYSEEAVAAMQAERERRARQEAAIAQAIGR